MRTTSVQFLDRFIVSLSLSKTENRPSPSFASVYKYYFLKPYQFSFIQNSLFAYNPHFISSTDFDIFLNMLLFTVLLSIFAIQNSYQIDVSEWQMKELENECSSAGNGNIPMRNDCLKYAVCENNQLRSVEQCLQGRSSFVSMFSLHHRKCVPTGFAHCQTMNALCPTLNASRILQRMEDIESVAPEMEDFIQIPGDRMTDTEEEILAIFFSINDGSNAVPFPSLLPQSSFRCPSASGLFPLSTEVESRDFIVCLGNRAYKTQCESDETFDAKEKDCVSSSLRAEYSGCRGMPDGVYSLPDSCSKFQVCCGDYGYISRCPLGFKFDDQTAHCVLSHYSQCTN